jgi:Radical SAM superfamily
MRVMRPFQLTILPTSQCTARCGHCSMNSGPERRGERLTFSQMRKAVDELHARSKLRVVIFAGGEPTLLGDALLDAIAHCDSLGIITRIVTNAYWAKTEVRARSVLNELREAGLAELNISCDDYHLPYIPFACVENAWKASKGQGFWAVIIANCFGPGSTITPDYIRQKLGENLPLRFDDDGFQTPLGTPSADGTYYGLSNAQVQLLGRATKEVDPSVLVYRGEGEDRLAGGCRWALRSAALSPNNHLLACCGSEVEQNEVLDFGSVDKHDAGDLAEAADEQVLLNAVALLGPKFLKDFIRERAPEIEWRPRYATVCEICEHVMKRPEPLAVLREWLWELAAHVWAVRGRLESDVAKECEAEGGEEQLEQAPSARAGNTKRC